MNLNCTSSCLNVIQQILLKVYYLKQPDDLSRWVLLLEMVLWFADARLLKICLQRPLLQNGRSSELLFDERMPEQSGTVWKM